MKGVASSTVPAAFASQMEKNDEEPIEWGDMDPSFARMLQNTPSMLQAYEALRTPKKMDLGSFQPRTNLTLPEPSSSVTLPDPIPRWLSIADSSTSALLLTYMASSAFVSHFDGSSADLPMERLTLDATGPAGPCIARFTLSSLISMEASHPWPSQLYKQNLPMKRFTLGVWGPGAPFTIRFTLCTRFFLGHPFPWNAPVDVAPCTYSVYKAAHRLGQLNFFRAVEPYSSPSQVRATPGSRKLHICNKYSKANFAGICVASRSRNVTSSK